jgi:hypothetical protein
LIKTLFKKIVHNKNDIFPPSGVIPGFPAESLPNRTLVAPFSHYLTSQANFLQGSADSTGR